MRSYYLAAVGIAVACAVTATPAAAQTTPAAGLDDAGRLSVDYKIKRFTVKKGKLYATATATARLSGPRDSTRTRSRNVTVPARIAQARGSRCSLISLSLATLRLDLLGLRVQTSPVNLRIKGVRSGSGAGVLGRLLCSLDAQRVTLGNVASARAAARSLNSELKRKPMRTIRATAKLTPKVAASQAQPSCEILDLVLGPLDLNVLGLVVELFGENRSDPVRITITAFRDRGVLGSLFCGLANTTLPARG